MFQNSSSCFSLSFKIHFIIFSFQSFPISYQFHFPVNCFIEIIPTLYIYLISYLYIYFLCFFNAEDNVQTLLQCISALFITISKHSKAMIHFWWSSRCAISSSVVDAEVNPNDLWSPNTFFFSFPFPSLRETSKIYRQLASYQTFIV